MDERSLRFVAEGCGGELLSGSPEASVRRVCTDSRQAQPGDVFFALPGERFDGHDFVAAVARTAAAVVVERPAAVQQVGDCGVIWVESTRSALGRLAARYRDDFTMPVIAVGGSNGKTSTKELIASVLRQKLATLWSEASFNNNIGVPLTLLRLEKGHAVAVLEVGTNHPGELAPLVRMARPTLGVITSIGREHLEFFHDLAGVAAEEGSLAELLPAAGKLFVNGDSPQIGSVIQRASAPVVRVGFGPGNDWTISQARLEKAGTVFRLTAPAADYSGEYRMQLLGRHQALNAAFAIALGCELGLGRIEIEQGLAQCRPAKMRMELWEVNGVQVLDDAYNANADSMAAALETLAGLPCKGRRVAVLGDMAELGSQGPAAHEEVGRRAAELGVAQLFAVGKMAGQFARGARAAGLNRVFEFAEVEPAGTAMRSFVKPGDVVLIKASRAMRLERLAELLREGGAAKT